jgi:hypothetical protein
MTPVGDNKVDTHGHPLAIGGATHERPFHFPRLALVHITCAVDQRDSC